MEILSFIINILLIALVCYMDFANRKERNELTLKLMSKDVQEFTWATTPPEKPKEEKPDPYVEATDVDPTVILKAEDKL